MASGHSILDILPLEIVELVILEVSRISVICFIRPALDRFDRAIITIARTSVTYVWCAKRLMSLLSLGPSPSLPSGLNAMT